MANAKPLAALTGVGRLRPGSAGSLLIGRQGKKLNSYASSTETSP